MKRHKDVYRINLKKNICGHGPYRNEIEEKLQIVTQYAHKEGRCNQIQDKFKAENGTHVLTPKSGDFMFSIDMHHNFLPHIEVFCSLGVINKCMLGVNTGH